MSDHYAKLMASITLSTLWTETPATRVVWITMLAIADRQGDIFASIPGLARIAHVTLEETEKALAVLSSPDRYSRTPDHEGRRISPIDGGWRLLNYKKFRGVRSPEERREYWRQWKAERRARKEGTQGEMSTESTESTEVTPPSPSPPPSPPPGDGGGGDGSGADRTPTGSGMRLGSAARSPSPAVARGAKTPEERLLETRDWLDEQLRLERFTPEEYAEQVAQLEKIGDPA